MTAGGGGSNMEFGDDYVAARLSVEVPEGTTQGVKELSDVMERFRVTMEATTRAEADMSRYLDSMAEAGKRVSEIQTNLIQQMQTIISLSARGGVGGASGTSGVPAGPATAPFGGSTPGLGIPGARPPAPADATQHLSPEQRQDLNMRQVRGQIGAADTIDISPKSLAQMANKFAEREKATKEQEEKTDGNQHGGSTRAEHATGGPSMNERIARGSNLAGAVMNEMGTGGSVTGTAQLAIQGINWARERAEKRAAGRSHEPESTGTPDPPGMPTAGTAGRGSTPESVAAKATAGGVAEEGSSLLGGVGKMLGPIGAVATAALSVFGLINKGGEMVQGLRDVASVRGGAAGEGFNVEMKTRMMSAMNPFINRDQARQMFQAAMSEGYADASGEGADNVIDFMKHNMTSMNISVADSAKMLRTTIMGNQTGDKESVNGAVKMLRDELDTIRTLSKDSVISTPDFRNKVMGVQEGLTRAGGSNAASAREALIAESVGRGDHVLEGQFADTVGGLGGTSKGNMMLRALGGMKVPAGLDPEMTGAYLTNHGQLDEASWNVMSRFEKMAAQRDNGTEVGHLNAIKMFQRYAGQVPGGEQAAGDVGAAEAYYSALKEGKGLDEARARVGKEHLPTGSGGKEERTQNVNVGGNVTLDLTPEAAKMFRVSGPNPVPLSSVNTKANRGIAGSQVNDPNQ